MSQTNAEEPRSPSKEELQNLFAAVQKEQVKVDAAKAAIKVLKESFLETFGNMDKKVLTRLIRSYLKGDFHEEIPTVQEYIRLATQVS